MRDPSTHERVRYVRALSELMRHGVGEAAMRAALQRVNDPEVVECEAIARKICDEIPLAFDRLRRIDYQGFSDVVVAETVESGRAEQDIRQGWYLRDYQSAGVRPGQRTEWTYWLLADGNILEQRADVDGIQYAGAYRLFEIETLANEPLYVQNDLLEAIQKLGM